VPACGKRDLLPEHLGQRRLEAALGVGRQALVEPWVTTLVVPDVTEEFIRDDLVGLGAAVDEFRSRLGMA